MAVDVEISEHIATITMNRPEALNAFDNGQLRAMTAAFRGIGGDRDVRAVILTGAGLKAFAAGADIKEMAEMTAAEGLAFARLGHAMALAIENLARPVIAAVNGYALSGGSEAALACGLR
ncbi:MAG: enoyl-CoA hydratase-related protein, partial [Thermomicrobiales bacterium]